MVLFQKNLQLYKKELKKGGFKYFINSRVKKITRYFLAHTKLLKKSQIFFYNGKFFNYFYHRYNTTWDNERAIEIPISLSFINKYRNKEILEVGNVLSHYANVNHLVIDKYEIAPNVLNEDAAFFKTKKKYSLIISISTLEHIGWDEKPKNPNKVLYTIDNLYSLLEPDGVLFFTIPIAYNPHINKIINNKKIKNCSYFFMKRFSEDNQWKQCTWSDVKKLQYGFPYLNANAIAVGIIKNSRNLQTPRV